MLKESKALKDVREWKRQAYEEVRHLPRKEGLLASIQKAIEAEKELRSPEPKSGENDSPES